MKKINQELIALFDKYGSDRRRALRENKKLSYLYALADLRENLLDWYQFDPEQQALQVGADAGALTGLLARRLSSVTMLDASEENLEVVRRRFQTEPELAAKIRYVCADVETYARETEKCGGTYGYVVLIGDLTAADRAGRGADDSRKTASFCSWNLDCGGVQLVWREIHGRRRAGERCTFLERNEAAASGRGILLSDAGLPDGGRDFFRCLSAEKRRSDRCVTGL